MTLFDFEAGDTPLLVNVPHAGTRIPDDIAARMTPAARALPDTDWFVDRLYRFAREMGASMQVARYSRYVVDCINSAWWKKWVSRDWMRGSKNDPQPVKLAGIVVREARPGWLTLDVPPLEHWGEPMKWLTPEQKTRIESAEFYEMLQGEITRRLVSLPPPTA